MNIVAAIFGFLFIIVILQDSFEAIVLPRRVSRRFRLSRMFYVWSWILWSALARKIKPGKKKVKAKQSGARKPKKRKR